MPYISDFFVLRTPLMPFGLATEFFKNPKQQNKILKNSFGNTLLQEAIYLASNELYAQLLKYLRDEVIDNKKRSSLEETLSEYLLRLSARCTPFGLFAGISIGNFGEGNSINLAANTQPNSIYRALRLDSTVIAEMVRYFEALPKFRDIAVYHLNSSAYKIGRKLRFIEYKITNGRRSYNLTEIDLVSPLAKIINKSNDGITVADAMAILLENGYGQEESYIYIQDLINSQVLVSEIEPSIIGEDFFNILTEKVQSFKLPHGQTLSQIKKIIENIDNDKPDIGLYQKLADKIEPFDSEKQIKTLFQVDLNINNNNISLNNDVHERLFEAGIAIMALNPADLGTTNLELFKMSFFEKYEFAPVRLVDAMDTEIGINYKKLQETSKFKNQSSNPQSELIRRFKRAKLNQCLSDRTTNIDITTEEMLKFGIKLSEENLPQSFSIMAKVLDKDAKSLQIESLAGPSFSKLLGRFCNSNEQLKAEVWKMTSKEMELFPWQTLAEIVHLPDDKTGNVLNRPHLSMFEIPYLGKSRLPAKNQVRITDLYLKMVDKRLIIFCKKLGREIYPRLSSAHNYSGKSLPIYHFLSDMQSQSKQNGARWHWDWMNEDTFLPRVTYKDVILSPATWNIAIKDLLKDSISNKSMLFLREQLNEFLILHKVNRYIYYCVSDNKLLLDIKSDFGITYLLKKIVKQQFLKLEEVLFNEKKLLVQSSMGGYVHELIIPYIRKNIAEEYKKVTSLHIPKIRRSYGPGSRWVYYKLYIGHKTSNFLLFKIIFPFVQKKIREKIVEKWFFVRYADPNLHLRLRFFLKDERNSGIFIYEFDNLIRYYTKNLLISNLLIDTYTREIERYGESTMEISETFFSVNSEFICSIYQKCDWTDLAFTNHLAFSVIDEMLKIFFKDIEERYEFINESVEVRGLGKFAKNKRLKDLYNKSYRKFIAEIENFRIELNKSPSAVAAIKKQNTFICNNLSILYQDSKNGAVRQIIYSYIHMFVNRLFEEGQNEKEGRLYFYLEKYYRSLIGRNKINTKRCV